jgi:hypothetical protein
MDEENAQPTHENPEQARDVVIEKRSVDAETIFQGMTAVGVLAGGAGGLLAGAAQWKDSGGGDAQDGQQPQADPQATPPEPE